MTRDVTLRERLQEIVIFSGLPRSYTAQAARAWQIIEPVLPDMLNRFYDFIDSSGFTELKIAENRTRMIEAQSHHLKVLFGAGFTDDYIEGVTGIGMRHRLINLSPSNFITGYGYLSAKMCEQIRQSLPGESETALNLVQTIHGLIFVDMGLALSVFDEEVELL